MPTCAHRWYHDHIVQRLLTSDLELLIFEEAGSVPLVDRQSVRFIDGLVPALALQRRQSHVCAFCGPGVRTELLYVHVWFFFDMHETFVALNLSLEDSIQAFVFNFLGCDLKDI